MKDLSRVFCPFLWPVILRKFHEIIKNTEFKVWGIRYFCNEETFSSLFEMFFLKERIRFKDFLPKRGDIVIDCGASAGDITLVYSKLVGEKGKVIAIEPNKESFRFLLKNLEANNANNVVPLRLAVVDKKRKIKMSKARGYDRICSTRGNYEVEGRSIDWIARRLKRVDLIKIDVEGAEDLVVKGMLKTIEKFKPKLIIEIHGWLCMKKRKYILHTLLEKFKYKIVHEFKIINNTVEVFLKREDSSTFKIK